MSDEMHDGCGCKEYKSLSRRHFLQATATISAASMYPAWLPKVSLANSHASNRDVIVSIFLRGGADGLALVAPFGDPAYYAARPTIAIPRPDASANPGVNLDGFFAFAPAMAGLAPAFAARDLLIVHGAGIETNDTRSHFDAQRFMEVGKPADTTIFTGWLGRHLASIPPAKPGAPLRAIGLANGLQKTLVAPAGDPYYAAHTLPISDLANFTIGGSSATSAARTDLLQRNFTTAEEPLKSSALDAINTVGLLKAVNFNGYKPDNHAVYPTSTFGSALQSVAALIKADVGLEAAQVDANSWDTHADTGPINGAMAQLMRDLANAVGAFHADVIALGKYNVTVIMMSEFGRNVRENASGGTDHGRGGAIFAMGTGIAGGRVLTKNWKTLDRANLESEQDLPVGIDYRDVLSEIVQNRLGNPNLDFIFPTWTPTMLGVTR
jgi:uncharacterized protein (DUF1501 family)